MLTGLKHKIRQWFNAPEFIQRDRISLGPNYHVANRAVFHADGEYIRIGKNSRFDIGVYVRLWGGKIEIGDNFFIGPYSVLYGHGGLRIGNNVLIASHVTIIPANHNFESVDKPINAQDETRLGIVIEDDVWIATGAVILDGVTIGKGSVIAAGAVINKNVPPYSIIGGVPGRILKSRI